MKSRSSRTFSLFLLGLALACAPACSSGLTDIVSTSSEGPGPWDVMNAHVADHTITADVCMSRPGAADVVSNRLLMQLKSKGYQRIQFAMYAPQKDGAERAQVSWTPVQGKQEQPASQTAQTPCNAHNAANPPDKANELAH